MKEDKQTKLVVSIIICVMIINVIVLSVTFIKDPARTTFAFWGFITMIFVMCVTFKCFNNQR